MLRLARPMLIVAVAMSLAACVEDIPDVTASRGNVRQAIARGALRSPRPATVAFASLDGAPGDQSARFKAEFARQATEREISMVDPGSARYLIRGYLSVTPGQGGLEASYVYDLFDAERRRVERVADTLALPSSNPANDWAALDDRAVSSLAGRGADDLAVALAHTPEAQSGALALASPSPGR